MISSVALLKKIDAEYLKQPPTASPLPSYTKNQHSRTASCLPSHTPLDITLDWNNIKLNSEHNLHAKLKFLLFQRAEVFYAIFQFIDGSSSKIANPLFSRIYKAIVFAYYHLHHDSHLSPIEKTLLKRHQKLLPFHARQLIDKLHQLKEVDDFCKKNNSKFLRHIHQHNEPVIHLPEPQCSAAVFKWGYHLFYHPPKEIPRVRPLFSKYFDVLSLTSNAQLADYLGITTILGERYLDKTTFLLHQNMDRILRSVGGSQLTVQRGKTETITSFTNALTRAALKLFSTPTPAAPVSIISVTLMVADRGERAPRTFGMAKIGLTGSIFYQVFDVDFCEVYCPTSTALNSFLDAYFQHRGYTHSSGFHLDKVDHILPKLGPLMRILEPPKRLIKSNPPSHTKKQHSRTGIRLPSHTPVDITFDWDNIRINLENALHTELKFLLFQRAEVFYAIFQFIDGSSPQITNPLFFRIYKAIVFAYYHLHHDNHLSPTEKTLLKHHQKFLPFYSRQLIEKLHQLKEVDDFCKKNNNKFLRHLYQYNEPVIHLTEPQCSSAVFKWGYHLFYHPPRELPQARPVFSKYFDALSLTSNDQLPDYLGITTLLGERYLDKTTFYLKKNMDRVLRGVGEPQIAVERGETETITSFTNALTRAALKLFSTPAPAAPVSIISVTLMVADLRKHTPHALGIAKIGLTGSVFYQVFDVDFCEVYCPTSTALNSFLDAYFQHKGYTHFSGFLLDKVDHIFSKLEPLMGILEAPKRLAKSKKAKHRHTVPNTQAFRTPKTGLSSTPKAKSLHFKYSHCNARSEHEEKERGRLLKLPDRTTFAFSSKQAQQVGGVKPTHNFRGRPS
jgi:hypothetical protein